MAGVGMLENLLNWTATMVPLPGEGQSGRVGIVKALLGQMTLPELNKIKSILSHAVSKSRAAESKSEGTMTTPAPSVTALVPLERSVLQFPTSKELKILIRTVDEWWKKFKPTDFVAFDAEFVQVRNAIFPSEVNKAATVAVYQNEANYLQESIAWDPSKIRINRHTIRVNGITYEKATQGKTFSDVKKIIQEKLKGKIVLTVGGYNDFCSLDLNEDDYLSVDLQTFYFRSDPNNCQVNQGMSLRDMYHYHFQEDCQRSAHSSLADAKNTLRVFKEGFVNLDYYKNKSEILEEFECQPNLNSKAKYDLYWCSKDKKFDKLCSCCK